MSDEECFLAAIRLLDELITLRVGGGWCFFSPCFTERRPLAEKIVSRLRELSPVIALDWREVVRSGVSAPRLWVQRGEHPFVEYPLFEGLNIIGRADEKPVDIDMTGQVGCEGALLYHP